MNTVHLLAFLTVALISVFNLNVCLMAINLSNQAIKPTPTHVKYYLSSDQPKHLNQPTSLAPVSLGNQTQTNQYHQHKP